MTIELTALGTGSMSPTKHCNTNGYFVRMDGLGVLFDPSDGIVDRLVKEGIKTKDIDLICVTHFHADHCLGLPGLLYKFQIDGLVPNILIHHSNEEMLNKMAESFLSNDPVKMEVITTSKVITGSPLSLSHTISKNGRDFYIQTALLDHRVPTIGFRVKADDHFKFDKAKLDEYGIEGKMVAELKLHGVIKAKGANVYLSQVSEIIDGSSYSFIMDTAPCEEIQYLSKNVNTMICESTFLEAQIDRAREVKHMTAKDAASAAKLSGAKSLLLTHYSPRYHKEYDECNPFQAQFENEAREIFDTTMALIEGDAITIAT